MLTTDKVILGSTLDMETRSVMVGCVDIIKSMILYVVYYGILSLALSLE